MRLNTLLQLRVILNLNMSYFLAQSLLFIEFSTTEDLYTEFFVAVV